MKYINLTILFFQFSTHGLNIIEIHPEVTDKRCNFRVSYYNRAIEDDQVIS